MEGSFNFSPGDELGGLLTSRKAFEILWSNTITLSVIYHWPADLQNLPGKTQVGNGRQSHITVTFRKSSQGKNLPFSLIKPLLLLCKTRKQRVSIAEGPWSCPGTHSPLVAKSRAGAIVFGELEYCSCTNNTLLFNSIWKSSLPGQELHIALR